MQQRQKITTEDIRMYSTELVNGKKYLFSYIGNPFLSTGMRDVQVLGIHIGESRSISSNLGKNIHAIHSDRMGIQSYAIGVRSAINHVNKHGFGSEVLSNVKRGAIDEIREMKEKAPYIVYKSLPKAVEQSILIDYLSDRTCKRDIVREFSESYKPAPDALGSLATKN